MASSVEPLRTDPPHRKRDTSGVAKTFFAGVAVAVPFIITIAALWWFGDRIVSLVQRVLPQVPSGLALVVGVALGVVVFYLLGLQTRVLVVRELIVVGEWVLLRIPLARTLYEATRNLMKFFGGGPAGRTGQVVRVQLNESVQMLGLLTNEQPRGAAQPAPGEPGWVSVFLPMSYTFGGFTVYVRRERVEPVDMTIEQAMKIAATADVAEAPAAASPTQRSAAPGVFTGG